MDEHKEKNTRRNLFSKAEALILKNKLKREFTGENAEKTLIKALYGVGAFFLARGEWLFGCFPFGIALLCSAKENLWFIWGGCMLASFFTNGVSPFVFAALYTLILTVRTKTISYFKERDKRRFSAGNETLGVKIALSVVFSFVPGLYGCIAESFSLHSLFALLFYLSSGGILTLLYSGAFYGVDKVLRSEGIPRCDQCGGVVKPSVVLYGEAPDKYVCIGACREISNADTLIVAGTSLSVEPAASFLDYFSGKHLVVINREPTPADGRASLVLRGDVADILADESL